MEVSMARRKFQDGESQLDDLAEDLERMDRDSAGQSGAIEGLSPVPEAGTESVEELAATDQAFEAEAVAWRMRRTILRGLDIPTTSMAGQMIFRQRTA
jgi:hypothetical protein